MMKYECPECHKKYGLTKKKESIMCPWCGSKIKVEARKPAKKVERSLISTTTKRKTKKRKRGTA